MLKSNNIKVFAPATVANVTCGFDILGFALDAPGDEVELKLTKAKSGITIKKITGDSGLLPYDPDKNTVSVAIKKFLERIKSDIGVEITLHKKMPLGSGLGSSAASSAAAIVAINELLETKFSRNQLVEFAMEGEKIASGSAHADNVAPAIMGGFTIIRSYDPLDIIKIPTPKDLYATVIHPHIEINTRDARNIIRTMVPLKKAIAQWGNVAGLIAGLTMSDYDLISRSMQDVIIEPARSILLPGFDNVKQSALEAGALGCGISGSGPSIFTLSRTQDIANNVAVAMTTEFKKIKIKSETFVSKINLDGCKII
jgi:homoserine kinase